MKNEDQEDSLEARGELSNRGRVSQPYRDPRWGLRDYWAYAIKAYARIEPCRGWGRSGLSGWKSISYRLKESCRGSGSSPERVQDPVSWDGEAAASPGSGI